jgi:hypothetical protein
MSRRTRALGAAMLTAVVTALAGPAAASADTSAEPVVSSAPYTRALDYPNQVYVTSDRDYACARQSGVAEPTCFNPSAPLQADVGSCGPGRFGDSLVPDSGSFFNFTGPCSRHDSCYHTRSVSRYTCDTRFRDEMDAVCRNSYAGSTRCYVLSDVYYGAVRAFGWLRY